MTLAARAVASSRSIPKRSGDSRRPSWKPGSGDLADAVEDLEQEPRPVLGGPAVPVGADVVPGVEELADQVAVGAVHLDAVEAGSFGPAAPPRRRRRPQRGPRRW